MPPVVSSTVPPIDLLILTAANHFQAQAYEAQLQSRQERGSLADVAAWAVLADPKGRRIGSGAATINSLVFAARRFAKNTPGSGSWGGGRSGGAASFADVFAGKRILILHSGGDSRRLPAYAAQGKVFAPLPCWTADGHCADLFDLVFEDCAALLKRQDAARGRGRVLVAAGDLLLNVSRGPLDLGGAVAGGGKAGGVVGVGFAGDYKRASKHGVYVADRAGRVRDFVQKPTRQEAAARGAKRADGTYLIDTGLVLLDGAASGAWLAAAGVKLNRSKSTKATPMVEVADDSLAAAMLLGRCPVIDLYLHILMAMAPEMDEARYFAAVGGVGGVGREGNAAGAKLRAFYEGLRGVAFSVAEAAECEFIHIGTTREYMQVVSRPRQFARPDMRAARLTTVFNGEFYSVDSPNGSMVVIEACESKYAQDGGSGGGERRFTCQGDALIVGVPRGTLDGSTVPPDMGLVCLPIGKQDWVAVGFGLDDDCKTSMEAGGTFMGRPLGNLAESLAVSSSQLWVGNEPDQERSLWTAALWRSGTLAKCVEDARLLVLGKSPKRGWTRSKRLSLRDIVRMADHKRLLNYRRKVQSASRSESVHEMMSVCDRMHLAGFATELVNLRDRRRVYEACDAMIELGTEVKFGTARAACLGLTLEPDMLVDDRSGRINPDAPLDAIRAELQRPLKFAKAPPRLKIGLGEGTGEVVTASSPVRIDLAGGWSDTPPICHEMGGCVVNMAVNLEGRPPIGVSVRRLETPEIRIHSRDLDEQCTLTQTAEVVACDDPHDWTSLVKAALILTGLAPHDSTNNLAQWLKRAGGGVEVVLSSALPKGSGLGTSSILGATVLAALEGALGRPVDAASLIARTTALEQLMSTAGGWQDQAGGVLPGMKSLTTPPGMDQSPRVRSLTLGPRCLAMLSERSLLYYTGYQRLAKNILRNVVSRHLDRDPECVRIVRQLKQGAAALEQAVAADDPDVFAARVAEYWTLKKAIDPGATNEKIEAIFDRVKGFLAAYELPGAGGGGFIFMIANSDRSAATIRNRLTARPPNAGARFFPYATDHTGLIVQCHV